MIQRLATEYVKTCLILEEAQWSEVLQLFESHGLVFRVKVLENGDREVVFENASGPQQVTLTFECKSGKYVLEGSCRFTDLNMANAMRKVVARFKGDAVVHRIYPSYILQYEYRRGSVARIIERTENGDRLVYELQDLAEELERRFLIDDVEAEIEELRLRINEWLDRRNESDSDAEKKNIDKELKRLAHRLFVLEA